MSGPKGMYVRRTPQRDAREQLLPLLALLKSQASAADGCGSAIASLEALRGRVGELRETLARFAATGSSRAELFAALSGAESCLKQMSALLASAPDAGGRRKLEERVQQLLQRGSFDEVRAARAALSAAVGALERVQALSKESASAAAAIGQLLRPAAHAGGGAVRGSDVAEREVSALRDALTAAKQESLEAEAVAARSLMADNLASRQFDAPAHAEALAAATACIASGELELATAHIERAASLRVSAAASAAEVLQKIALRNLLADRLRAALELRNYDQCDEYFAEGPGGDERALVVYGHNPSNTAHVRLTLSIDGGLVVEVDNVPEGEESICMDLLTAFQEAGRDIGDTLDITDAGRIAGLLNPVQERVQELERERDH